jgi:hypothetical protein
MGRQCRTNGEKRNTYRILDGTPEKKETTRTTKAYVGG